MAGNVNRAERRRQAAPTTELAAAVQHHQAGRLERAEALYRKFVKKAPGDPDALHLLGVIAFERGDAGRAIDLIGKALAVLPNFAPAHSNFISHCTTNLRCTTIVMLIGSCITNVAKIS